MIPAAATAILGNKKAQIAIGVALLLLVVYLYGYFKGKECTWIGSFLGTCEKEKNVTRNTIVVQGDGTKWNPEPITESIYNAYHNCRFYSTYCTSIETAFSGFNALNTNQRADVVNDWEQRIKGKDNSGWFTGDYGSLRETISEHVNSSFNWGSFPQEEQALDWLIQNSIS